MRDKESCWNEYLFHEVGGRVFLGNESDWVDCMEGLPTLPMVEHIEAVAVVSTEVAITLSRFQLSTTT